MERTFSLCILRIKLLQNLSKMAKKSFIQCEKKKQRLVAKFMAKRIFLKNKIKASQTMPEKFKYQQEIQKLPLNSSPLRLRNHCQISGYSRGFYRDFGLSRHVLREFAHQGFLPGVTKSSW